LVAASATISFERQHVDSVVQVSLDLFELALATYVAESARFEALVRLADNLHLSRFGELGQFFERILNVPARGLVPQLYANQKVFRSGSSVSDQIVAYS